MKIEGCPPPNATPHTKQGLILERLLTTTGQGKLKFSWWISKMKAWNWKRSSSQHAPSLYPSEKVCNFNWSYHPYLLPSGHTMVPYAFTTEFPQANGAQNLRDNPSNHPPASARGQGLHPIDLKSCCEGTQISREKPELTKGSESPGWWLKPQPPLVQICTSQNGNPSSPKFRGVFLPPPGFFFTPEN